MVLVAIMTACGGAAKPPQIEIDAGVTVTVDPPANCPELPAAAAFNFLGEACTAAPFPAVTTCDNDAGWCIEGTCRPQSSLQGATCPACPRGTEHFSPAGAGYCSPG
jgi:hypothetical protein